MHELSIVQNIVETTCTIAEERGIGHVSYVTLLIGDATGIEAKYVRMYYPEVVEGTALEGSEVRIEEVAEEAFCKGCGNLFAPSKTGRRCPECGKSSYDLLSGNELTIKEIAYL